jgi:hypothetical protein
MPKLTKQFIDSEIQLPVTGQRFYRDDDMPGFAIRVTRKSKSYILEKRVDRVNRLEMIIDRDPNRIQSVTDCILLGPSVHPANSMIPGCCAGVSESHSTSDSM